MSVEAGTPLPPRRRHPTMAEAALEELREAIILGELTPGTPLRLEDLAGRLGMSISPIREAVRRLEALGLAELVPHQGAKVVALDTDDLRDLFEVRLGLETTALRRACLRFAEADFARARAALDMSAAARDAGDVRGAMRSHTEFHFTLYEASGSHWLPRLIRPAWDSTERYRPALFSGPEDLQERHHRLDEELLAACRARDGDRAARALREHLALADTFYARELGGRSLLPPE